MRPPTTFQWLIGNPISSLAMMLAALFVVYLWLVGQATGWAALFALIAASGVAKVRQHVSAYSAWKREWDGIKGGGGFRMPRIPGLRYAFGFATWLCLALMTVDGAEGDPWIGTAILMFWMGTAVMGGVMVLGVFRAGRAPGDARIVTACLKVAHNSTRACPQIVDSQGEC